jgi:uncharacterized membrane protein YbaN (DUF454 family)
MKMKTMPIESLPAKLLAGIAVLACLVVGAVGLVLPIIPGLLFLAIGGVIIAKVFPSIERKFRSTRRIGRQLDRADSFFELSPLQKLQLGGLIGAKILLDTLDFLASSANKLRLLAVGKHRSYR